MRSRVVAVFLAGVLFGAVLLGGGVVALQHFGEDVQAQGENTWQVQYWSETQINNGFVSPDPSEYIDDWVRELPANCDIVPMGDVRNILFYRCPSS